MSVCIEQNHHNNFSQSLSACRQVNGFSLERITKEVNTWMSRSKQRRQLAHLDDRMLEDIGVTRIQVQQEVAKPFWK